MRASDVLLKYYFLLHKRIDAMSLIGRIATLAASLFVILIVWLVTVQLSIIATTRDFKLRLHAFEQSSSETAQHVSSITDNIVGGDIALQKQELDAEAKQTEQYLSILKGEIIPPKQMSNVLRDVLSKDRGLKLISFKILPKKTLVKTSSPLSQHQIALYQQNVQMALSGNYFDHLKYLGQLENLPWRFFWDDIEYDIATYPEASIVIKLHTLGHA
jgi:MSHA biogenesis protein MshJ